MNLLPGSASAARNARVLKRPLSLRHLSSPRPLRHLVHQKIARVASLHSAPNRFLVPKPPSPQDRRAVNLATNRGAGKRSANPFANRDRQSVREGANSTTSATLCKKNKTFCNANLLLPTTNRSASALRTPKGDAAAKKNNNAADVVDAAVADGVAVDPVKATVPRAIPLDRTPVARRSRVVNPQEIPTLNSSKSTNTTISMPTIARLPTRQLPAMPRMNRLKPSKESAASVTAVVKTATARVLVVVDVAAAGAAGKAAAPAKARAVPNHRPALRRARGRRKVTTISMTTKVIMTKTRPSAIAIAGSYTTRTITMSMWNRILKTITMPAKTYIRSTRAFPHGMKR